MISSLYVSAVNNYLLIVLRSNTEYTYQMPETQLKSYDISTTSYPPSFILIYSWSIEYLTQEWTQCYYIF